MIISNWKVYDLPECIKASKYPMLTDTNKAEDVLTETTKRLALSPKGEEWLATMRAAEWFELYGRKGENQ